MSILVADLRDLVVRPVLDRLERAHPGMGSKAAEDLLLGTAAQESQLGRYLRQHPEGPARGIYQMEPATLHDLLSWLATPEHDNLLRSALEWSAPTITIGAQVAGNLFLATALARMNYWRKPFKLGGNGDYVRELAAVWKRWWNTPAGGGTEAQFIANYARYVAP